MQHSSMQPAPVYIAQFAAGETVRVSFWAEREKPLTRRVESVRAWVCLFIGDERMRHLVPNLRDQRQFGPPASDLVDERVEWNGQPMPIYGMPDRRPVKRHEPRLAKLGQMFLFAA